MAETHEPLIPRSGAVVPTASPSLSARGVRVEFKDVTYELPSNVERGKIATVLRSISGYFNPGQMTAIMGPSGCGKSLLIDVLAGRRSTGKVTGVITYGGAKPTSMFLRRVTGYVEQFFTLVENLTVFEMLIYTAELKRRMEEGYDMKVQAVNLLIEKLALGKCRDTKIGNPTMDRGISGGQAKRVSVGIALITRPRVLYMDEPTSGLDSYTSNEVMGLVKNLVTEGLTLVATLHSPTPYVFNLFENICLLLRGQVVYFGRRNGAIPFFEPLAPTEAISADSDAEWLTDVIVKADAANKADHFAQVYETSDKKKQVLEELTSSKDVIHDPEIEQDLSVTSSTVTPSWFAVKTYLKHRTVKNYTDSKFWATRAADKIILAGILVSVYHGIGDDFSPDNFPNTSAIFLAWVCFSSLGASVYIPSLYTDRALFYREHRDGLYRVTTYFIVKMIEEMVVVAIMSAVACVLLWYAVDLQGDLGIFIVVFITNFWCGLAAAFFLCAIAPNLDSAVGGFGLYMTTVCMYCGFYIRPEDVPSYLRWYEKICFTKYSFGSFIINHYDSSDDGRNATVISEDPSERVTVLDYYGLNGKGKIEYFGYLLLFGAGYSLIALIAMKFVRFEKH